MTFNILKLAALGLVGWVLYRSFGTVWEQGEASEDGGSGDEAAAGGTTDAKAESGASASARTESASRTDVPAESVADPETPAEPSAATATAAAQDLSKIRGIGPAIATLLGDRGIATWAQLAATEVSDLQAILDEAGPRYRVHDPSTWPEQAAELAQAN